MICIGVCTICARLGMGVCKIPIGDVQNLTCRDHIITENVNTNPQTINYMESETIDAPEAERNHRCTLKMYKRERARELARKTAGVT